MNDRTLYRQVSEDDLYDGTALEAATINVVPVEPVDVVEMADHIDGWFTVSNAYAPYLPEGKYRVAIVIMEAGDE